MRELLIDGEMAGMRLDRVLAGYLKAADSGFLHKMLRKKNIVVNGKKADGALRVAKDDIITLFLSEETVERFRGGVGKNAEPEAKYLSAYESVTGDGGEAPAVLYEDEALILLNKPCGVLSQGDRSGDFSANDWLCGYLLHTGAVNPSTLTDFRPSAVNRLDRNTSGLLVCAKTRSGARAFSALQRKHVLQKTYHTIVFGRAKEAGAVYSTVSKEDGKNRVAVTKKTEGVSLTYRTLQYDRTLDATLLAVSLMEGKKHQIRAQMAAIGIPVAGDYKYGDPARNDDWKKRFGVGAQLLHSHSLTFPAILDGALCALSGKTFIAPYGELFEQAALRIYRGRHVVYILQCADGSFYCGYTNDIEKRVRVHNSGQGAKYTRARTPVRPVHIRAFDTKEAAMKEEWRVKQLSRAEKLALIR